MTSRTKVPVGVVLWLVATAHVITVLISPFMPIERTETLWRLLIAPLGVTAVLGFSGTLLVSRHGAFWTVRRLFGASALSCATTFAIALAMEWPGFDLVMSEGRIALLFVVTTVIMGPLGFSGLCLIITAKREKENEERPHR